MPNDNETQLVDHTEKAKNTGPLIDENVTAHMMQIFGSPAQQYVPTQAQVDKILALQEKGMDYTHEERTMCSPIQKIEFTVFLVVVLVLLIIFVLSLFFAREYLGEIISGIVGLFAGGAGGYGYAKSKKIGNNNE